ncbi:MAG TPA: hypothetical protein VG204_21765 [Terriglobia bacterium]|nr:hypothetical protein [Terriglobia bacterium]
MRILVVDDDPAFRERLAATIATKQGCEVLTRGTIEQTAELIDRVDAVLCDASFAISRKWTVGYVLVTRPPAELFDTWLAERLAVVTSGKRFVLLARNFDTLDVAVRLNVPAYMRPFGTSPAMDANLSA